MRDILNKMTPQKFQTLIHRAQRLHINTEQKLTGVVDLIFEKVSCFFFLFDVSVKAACPLID